MGKDTHGVLRGAGMKTKAQANTFKSKSCLNKIKVAAVSARGGKGNAKQRQPAVSSGLCCVGSGEESANHSGLETSSTIKLF